MIDDKFKKPGGAKCTMAFVEEKEKFWSTTQYSIPKYITFIRRCLEAGYQVKLYNAQKTVSKYVTVSRGKKKTFKVRFSNHKPIAEREARNDCDFFVGVNNFQVTTMEDAWKATQEYLGVIYEQTNTSEK